MEDWIAMRTLKRCRQIHFQSDSFLGKGQHCAVILSFQSLFPFWQSGALVHRVMTRVKLVCKFCASGGPNEEFCEQ